MNEFCLLCIFSEDLSGDESGKQSECFLVCSPLSHYSKMGMCLYLVYQKLELVVLGCLNVRSIHVFGIINICSFSFKIMTKTLCWHHYVQT